MLTNTTTDCRAINSALDQYHLQIYKYSLKIEHMDEKARTLAKAATAITTTYSSNNAVTPAKQPPTNSTYGFRNNLSSPSTMSSDCFSLAPMPLLSDRSFHTDDSKPQHSYIGLIAMAILNSEERKLVLSDIYKYILDNYSYFRNRGSGWRNSIRHNLSLNDCFIKSGRSVSGKGHYWAIHAANIDDFRRGDFRRRKAQRRVRKHMGLILDDNIMDSSSPPMDLTAMNAICNLTSKSLCQPLTTCNENSFKQLHFTPHHSGIVKYHSASSSMAEILTKQQLCDLNPYQYATNQGSVILQQQAKKLHIPNESYLANHHHRYHQLHEANLQLQKKLFPIANLHKTPIGLYAKGNLINDILISHNGKRKFDVASLLAPDNYFVQSFQGYQQSQLVMCQSCEYGDFLQNYHMEQRRQLPTNTPRELRNIVTNEVAANRIHGAIDKTETHDIEVDIDVDVDVDNIDNEGLYATISDMIRSKAKIQLATKYQSLPNFTNGKINIIHP